MKNYADRVGQPNQLFDKDVVLPPQVPRNMPTHDHFGLSQDPKHWAKPSCKTCNGQGVFKFVKNVPASDMIKGAKGMNHTVVLMEPCPCALKAYQKVALPLHSKALEIWHTPGLSDEKRHEAVLALVRETLVQVRNTGKISSVKEMIDAAEAAAQSRMVRPSGRDVARVNRTRR